MSNWTRPLAVVTTLLALVFATLPANAEMAAREGWVISPTKHAYKDLVEKLNAAAKANKIGVVTRASATVGAKKVLDKTIPGNMIVGLYHPRFAVRMLDASIAAGIEAPIRMYLTENADGTSTLSYRKPSSVFAPYMDEGGDKLKALASELDTLFANVAADTVR